MPTQATRKPLEDRWEVRIVDMIKVVLWRVSDDDPDVDGEKLVVETWACDCPNTTSNEEARADPVTGC